MAFKLKFKIKLIGSSWKFLIFLYYFFKEESLDKNWRKKNHQKQLWQKFQSQNI